MARRRLVGGIRGRQFPGRRETAWDKGFQVTGQVSADGITVLQGLTGSGIGGGLVTLARIRGELLIAGSSGTTPDSIRVAIGAGLVTDEAFAIGATAVPGPLASEEWDGWMWYQAMSAQFRGGEGQGRSFRFVIDSKSMRKFDLDSVTLALIIEAAAEVGAVVLDVMVTTRTLVILP